MISLSDKIASFLGTKPHSADEAHDMLKGEALADSATSVLAFDEKQENPIPRYLQLARAIHSRISDAEEKELIVYRTAEALALRKNEIIMRAVQEVVEFCALLQNTPELGKILEAKALEITDRFYSNRSHYTIEHEPISVQYDAPMYQVDMCAPDHIRLIGGSNSTIQISFNPVKFALNNGSSSEGSTVTQYLFSKQYRIGANGIFHSLNGNDKEPVDPIAEILTELRLKLGFEFFDKHLLPFLEGRS